MKRIIQIVLVAFIGLSLSSCGYNSMVEKSEAVAGQWAQVENTYQRRADLIPNLVNTVKGYADFEQQTLTDVIEARSKATSINVNAESLDPSTIAKFQAAGTREHLQHLFCREPQAPHRRCELHHLEIRLLGIPQITSPIHASAWSESHRLLPIFHCHFKLGWNGCAF